MCLICVLDEVYANKFSDLSYMQKPRSGGVETYGRYCIHSIHATTAAVERQFRGAGLGISERRTNLNPAQVDYALPVRSVEKSTTSYTVNN